MQDEYTLKEINDRQKRRPIKDISYCVTGLVIQEIQPYETNVLRYLYESPNAALDHPHYPLNPKLRTADYIPIHKFFNRDNWEDIYINCGVAKDVQEFLKLPFDYLSTTNIELTSSNDYLKKSITDLERIKQDNERTIRDLARDTKFQQQTIKAIEKFTFIDRLKFLFFGKSFLVKWVY